jgi:nucleoside diphosphate kinase
MRSRREGRSSAAELESSVPAAALLRVEEALSSDALSLLIFLPDAVMSRVVAPVEHWLRERTGCVPIARRWLTRTDEELRRFYPDVAQRYWPLISRAFSWGPCLATLWFGERAAHVIPASKGVTQPARCSPATVRGRFWCDNALANLLHVSDNSSDVARELGVLRSYRPELFREKLSTQGLPTFDDGGAPTPRHSAILTLCSLVRAPLAALAGPLPPLDVPEGESARETMTRAEAWLAEVAPRLPPILRAAVLAYLDGMAPERFIPALKDLVPLTEWEELVLTGGALSRGDWLEVRAASAARG